MRRLNIITALISLIGLLVMPISTVFAAPSTYLGPVFDAPTEIELQAVIAGETLAAVSDPTLNHRLAEVRIRTALEDTARLRNELG